VAGLHPELAVVVAQAQRSVHRLPRLVERPERGGRFRLRPDFEEQSKADISNMMGLSQKSGEDVK
jgi:hypothetical protein